MDGETLLKWMPIIISVFSLMISAGGVYYSFRANADRKKQMDNMKRENDLAVIRKVFPVEIDGELHRNKVGIYNNSSYPIYDIFVLQGINTLHINEVRHYGAARYIRSIEPKTKMELEMENAGLGMNKYYVVGMFFRDYKSNEWFRDSMGKLERSENYKEMLSEKRVAIPPYMAVIGRRSSLH